MSPLKFGALLGLLAFAGATAAHADLAGTSPFLPRGGAGVESAASGPSGPLELRGVMASSQGASYCIYDVAKKRDIWVGLNESGYDFVVRSADAAGDSVTVDYQGRSLKLAFHTAKIASSGSGSQPAAAAAPVVLNPSPAEEQKRLDAVAQEVRRRRLEREKAAQGPPPGAPNR